LVAYREEFCSVVFEKFENLALVKVPCFMIDGFQHLNTSIAYNWPLGCRHQVFEMVVTTYQTVWCSTLRKIIREAKRLYFNELIVNSENKVKKTWKIIKNLTKKYQQSQHV
jgi:hypothetical protein